MKLLAAALVVGRARRDRAESKPQAAAAMPEITGNGCHVDIDLERRPRQAR